MDAKGDSEGFVSSPLDGQGARHKDSYFLMSDENTAELKDTDAEFTRLKADFLRIARNRRRRDLSRSESSGRPSPVRRQPQRRSTNLPKFKIATFYSTDVELWFNQIETQFYLHQITDDDERYRLTCAALWRQTTNYRSWFSHTLQLTGRLRKSLSERHANRFSYTSYFIVY